jgi:hypothetical protein
MERHIPELYWSSKTWHLRSRPESILPPSVSHLLATSSKGNARQHRALEKNLEEIMSGLIKKLESGQWEPADSEVLIQLLESGWHSKPTAVRRTVETVETVETSGSSHSPSIDSTRQTVPPTGNRGARRRSFHLDVSHENIQSVNQPAASTVTHCSHNESQASPTGEGGFSELTTPRSWVTAASVLPTSLEDLEGLGDDEIRQLVAEARELQQRAEIALSLVQSRHSQNQKTVRTLWPPPVIVEPCIACIAVLRALPVYASMKWMPGRMLPFAYSALGALVGTVEGVFTRMWKRF